jgi:hypothetical protein
MDPLSAVGLAASVVQFVTFAGGLLRKSIEIHDSTSGLPNALDLNDTYKELNRLNSSLRGIPDVTYGVIEMDPKIQRETESVKDLASICQFDCEILLNVLDKIRVKEGPGRRFKSFKAAFKASQKDGEIKRLKKRLAEAERQITLLLCHISK